MREGNGGTNRNSVRGSRHQGGKEGGREGGMAEWREEGSCLSQQGVENELY